jgi:hypothetical protein
LRWGRVQDDGVTLTLPESADWLNDETAWVVSSDASIERAESFDAGSSVVLLHLEPKLSGENGPASTSVDADGGRPRIVVWIEVGYSDPGGAPQPLRRPTP